MAEPGCQCSSLTLSDIPDLALEVVALIWDTQNLSLGVEQDIVWKVSTALGTPLQRTLCGGRSSLDWKVVLSLF